MKYAEDGHPRGLSMPRSRGAVSGLLLVILGAWGALRYRSSVRTSISPTRLIVTGHGARPGAGSRCYQGLPPWWAVCC